MRLSSLSVYPDAVSHPPSLTLPDSPADEMHYFDELRAAMEATTPAGFEPIPEPQWSQISDRFPWGYPRRVPYGPQVAFVPGTVRPFNGQIYVGTARIDCGRFASHIEALKAVVIHARKLAASRLLELRRAGKCPKLPRLRDRQPWRFSA
jgi:hypothetical protein